MKSATKTSTKSRDTGYSGSQLWIPEPGTFSKRFPSTVSTYATEEEDGSDSIIAMGMGLTAVGVVWTLASLLATCLCCAGFVFPYWIAGATLDGRHVFHFGLFRRCNYPTANGEIALGCGRYSSFEDIPTLSWQLGTLLIGAGCLVSMLVAFTGVLACCMKDLVTQKVGRVAGVLQLFAACLVGAGCALYPNGWDHPQVKMVCGEVSGAYQLGECKISWAYLVTVGGCVLLLLSALLSCRAGRRKLEAYRV
ncbi:lipoma HMGIC fusion partner-like isoform X2 [Acanthaster planci]|uniref:Lipoma HMGIC fusion partner-like isoform X2 n=1 Tax=Acanthaster planci TaxID=133434 RepID=A0A8B7Y4H3_ACAPL|nr:lipoma HMGIC fusion partner-like isoform X2 [Acanthaster planci]